MKSINKIIVVMLVMIFFTITLSYAGVLDDPGAYVPRGQEVTSLKTKGNKVIGVINKIGSIVAILGLLVMGIRFMLGSVEEKAQYKETMMPYVIGAFLLYSAPKVVLIIQKMMQ